MVAKKYIERVNKICDYYDKKGQCNDGCPLKKYSCGLPRDNASINAVIKIVEEFEVRKQGICQNCGRDNKELIEQQKIKFCPYCGASIEDKPSAEKQKLEESQKC